MTFQHDFSESFRQALDSNSDFRNHMAEAVKDYMTEARNGFFKIDSNSQDSNASTLLPELSFDDTDTPRTINQNQIESEAPPSDSERRPFNVKELGAQIVRDNFDEIDLDGDGFLRKRELKLFNQSQTGELERGAVGKVIKGAKYISRLSNDQVGKETGISKNDIDKQLDRIQTKGEFRGHPAPVEETSPKPDTNPETDPPKPDESDANVQERQPYNAKELGAQIVRDNFDEIDLDGDGFLRKRELKLFNQSQTGDLERGAVGKVIKGAKHISRLSNDQVGKETGISKNDLDNQIERIQTIGEFRGHPGPDESSKKTPEEDLPQKPDNVEPTNPPEEKHCDSDTHSSSDNGTSDPGDTNLGDTTEPQPEQEENADSNRRVPYTLSEMGAQIVEDNFDRIDLDGDGLLRGRELKIFNRSQTSRLAQKAVGKVIKGGKKISNRSNDEVGKETGISRKDIAEQIEIIQDQGRFRGHQV